MSQDDLINYDINLPYTKSNHQYLQYLGQDLVRPSASLGVSRSALRRKDKSLPNLVAHGVKVSYIQSTLGSVVEGVQLSNLSNAAKDEMAYLVSQRKVVAFLDQDLIAAQQQEFMKYFGKPNYQPVFGTVKGHPGLHIIHRDGNKEEIARFLEQKTTTLWHQNVSYEVQPPGYVMRGLLKGPDVGGDSVFATHGCRV